ncbi:unnamed protein product [Cutaneotrichosporon oleaginosum]
MWEREEDSVVCVTVPSSLSPLVPTPSISSLLTLPAPSHRAHPRTPCDTLIGLNAAYSVCTGLSDSHSTRADLRPSPPILAALPAICANLPPLVLRPSARPPHPARSPRASAVPDIKRRSDGQGAWVWAQSAGRGQRRAEDGGRRRCGARGAWRTTRRSADPRAASNEEGAAVGRRETQQSQTSPPHLRPHSCPPPPSSSLLVAIPLRRSVGHLHFFSHPRPDTPSADKAPALPSVSHHPFAPRPAIRFLVAPTKPSSILKPPLLTLSLINPSPQHWRTSSFSWPHPLSFIPPPLPLSQVPRPPSPRPQIQATLTSPHRTATVTASCPLA